MNWIGCGCGGHRDQGKRPLMGRIAETNADHVIITNDNPRDESCAAIVEDILQGMEEPDSAVVEFDRYRAIAHAITCAQPDDIVLIAGKGHEVFQEIGDEKKAFCDRVAVQKILSEL